MKELAVLPDIKLSLPLIFGAWCVGAWLAFSGPVMLAYPAMWAVVAVAFWGLDRALNSTQAGGAASSTGEPEE